MTDLFQTAERGDRAAAHILLSQLASGEPVTRQHLNRAMVQAFGGTDAEGRWTQRSSFEVLEHALALHLRGSLAPLASLADVAARIDLAQRLPTQTVRSEDQIEWQQFSTPVDIAAVAILLADVRQDDVILEPSAGNGLLVAQLGAHRSLHLNELDPIRRDRLHGVFPGATITGHDGAILDAALGDAPRPSLILMNPPFSRSLGRGVDDLAAVRHLQAALRRLQTGGRLVAIMPDWFGPTTRMRDHYETVLRGSTVQASVRLEGCYLKHGTSIDVRIFVIDKVAGRLAPEVIQGGSIAELLDVLTVTPRLSLVADQPAPAPKRGGGISLFRAVKSAKPMPRAFHAAVRNHVLPVAYTRLETPAPLLEQTGVYLPYRPSRLVFDKAGEHPTALVESVAMGSIPAPIPDYVPSLPERTVTERLLSASQLETVVYAGHAWAQTIPGRFAPDKDGVGLVISEEGRGYRKGFFLGDGTGAGKGRQIAAAILDNWLQGRRRNIWVTKNAPLLEDARRDWTALGGLAGDIQPISNWKIDEPIRLDQGVLLVTYPTLRSMRGEHSRLKQIIDWAGADFDGVIAFDEAHEMGGVAGGEGALGAKEGSQQGISGVRLQNHLPAARILYASATGASEVNNLAYAVRLGLWGPETAFANREQFISSIRQGGIAAMELVARDLKATGLYMARALSFAGVEYEILRHELTPAQIEIYDTYANAWSIIHRNMEKALELTGVVDGLENTTLNSGAKASARSRFESTKQRFFGQVLLSMKLPTVIAAVGEHLMAGQSVVLQLVTTAESILDRRLGMLSPDERVDLEIDLSPREYVIDYLERAFPTRQMRVFTDDTGTQRSEPMTDETGNPVYNPEAEAARALMIEHLCALPPIMSALDGILEHFGHDRVAEVTGRTKRLISTGDGRQKLETRSTRTSQAEAAAFMQGLKRVLIFSDAGGTGRSYHASMDVPNQEQRVHLLLEPGWRADRAIQGLGRTHRTHQASTPLFRPVTTDCKGELRFTSTIARRLDSLGALTRGQRQTGGQNLFDPADNLESEYACAALVTWFHLLVDGKLKSISHSEFEDRTGLELCDKDGVLKEELPPIQRWLNRILALPIGLQNSIFDEFLSLVETRVSAAREAGRLDVGVETILVDSATLIDDTLLRTDPVSGATSHLLTIEIARRRTPVTLERVLRIADSDSTAVFLLNARSGMVALQTRARALMEEKDGTPIPRFELTRPTRREYIREHELFESAWKIVDRDAFCAKWQAEADEAANKVDTETIRLATGLLLPIWSALPSDHLVVNRIADKAGNSWLGRLVFDEHVVQLFTKLGIDRAENLPPSDIIKSAHSGRSVDVARPFPMTIRRAMVNRNHRIEIVGAPSDQLAWLKSLGCFTEIIQYRTRVFLPVSIAADILGRILADPG
ncbi:MAG: methylase [Sphingobium sp.]|uniref:Strawberry notch family protein n=1 Tax=Sphingobium soli TaxID=1591116 RepID=A0ABS8H635_9SPHN|nr:strawberry notch family protein [Sphingobium soli]MAP45014.1 methylase [Sphingobium sp.]MCC4234012.1 strawberry notch family protein [Sphingobium soli]TAJ72649.1 MAG: methylase [Sphingobium sp.]|tara:strand:- start:3024 stop:7247 length:4224 start_codon:yes stop_codon:yes gene_type:complete